MRAFTVYSIYMGNMFLIDQVAVMTLNHPSAAVTLLLAAYCRRLYNKLREVAPKDYVRIWFIPLRK